LQGLGTHELPHVGYERTSQKKYDNLIFRILNNLEFVTCSFLTIVKFLFICHVATFQHVFHALLQAQTCIQVEQMTSSKFSTGVFSDNSIYLSKNSMDCDNLKGTPLRFLTLRI
jgi:hypothetical protein